MFLSETWAGEQDIIQPELEECLRRAYFTHSGCPAALEHLKEVALSGGNIFEEMLETVKHCSLGQITNALYEVGGQYRRSM